jgi:uncharacterized protein
MTENELQLLIRQYHAPQLIKAHMRNVASVAVFIGEKLVRRGEKIDLAVLRQAALLHDIVKICDFKDTSLIKAIGDFNAEDVAFWMKLHKSCSADGHITAAYKILTDLKEPLLAEIIRKHRYESIIDPDPSERPSTWAEKLLYYADKRVMHDKIVGMRKRLDDGRRRYFGGQIRPQDLEIEKELFKLESDICAAAGITPEDINESIL